MNDTVREFLLETHENLTQLDLDLVTLEKEPTERETLARVFRTLHNIKGTAGFLGLMKLQSVSHAAENLLSRLRAGELFFNAMIAGALLEAVDAIKEMLVAVEKTEGDGAKDYADLIASLGEIRAADTGEVPPVPASPPTLSVPSAIVPSSSQMLEKPFPGSTSQVFDKPVLSGSSQVFEKGMPLPKPASPGPKMPDSGTIYIPAKKAPRTDAVPPGAKLPQAPPPVTITSPIRLAPSQPAAPEPVPSAPAEVAHDSRAPAVSDTSIRVDVNLIDKIMALVGELVLARNQIVQVAETHKLPDLVSPVQRLNALTTDLQAGVMKTRMQPIGNIWTKFPRLVRDLALACKKQVRLDMEGRETELDRTIIEAIRDPLTHAVRNAIYHGIESPEERKAAGKPAEGRLVLHASHEGGKVIIQISDDGRGIDPQRVRERALKSEVLTEEDAQHMSDPELIGLVFLPGFSTAEKVDNFAGRGVGMDVVRTNVEKIGGTVEIESQVGRGTTIKLKIPLTLAIIPAIVVSSGGQRYAIPQVSLLELVCLDAELARLGIEYIHEAPVYRLRGQLLPLVHLSRQIRVDEVPADTFNMVVLQADERQFGLVVDAIHDTQEIVVKPLPKQLKPINAFSGATIMGDGQVALILDVMGLAQRARVLSDMRVRTTSDKPAPHIEPKEERQSILLVAAADGTRMAIPLTSVSRLEEFPRSALEKVGARSVVQYGDKIMPLIDVSRALRLKRNGRSNGANGHHATADTIQVVVHGSGDRSVGLAVGSFVDIVEESYSSRTQSDRPHVLFSAVVQGRVTEFLDVESVIRAAAPSQDDDPTASRTGSIAGRRGGNP
ncbi:MAG TPA: chemotaxis protein CheA [Gemmataceae bacterium]|nr:chemotaxis protein CheA [Gemmataceae bacterium]